MRRWIVQYRASRSTEKTPGAGYHTATKQPLSSRLRNKSRLNTRHQRTCTSGDASAAGGVGSLEARCDSERCGDGAAAAAAGEATAPLGDVAAAAPALGDVAAAAAAVALGEVTALAAALGDTTAPGAALGNATAAAGKVGAEGWMRSSPGARRLLLDDVRDAVGDTTPEGAMRAADVAAAAAGGDVAA